ncbi:hypothetical protein M9Y10_014828 [Tritrichomonas musculus]|uniref:UBA domain-containing protein n=1 Tax=Tritrichomonas musculus TaxID=1915356 RepID=A0ABR2L0L0_9EUKA
MIRFEVINPPKSIELKVQLNDSFLDVAKQIFTQFGLNQKDFPSEKFPFIKFVYNSIICLKFKTLQSYGINYQSTVQVFIPKPLLPYFLNQSLKKPPLESNPNPSQKAPLLSNNFANNANTINNSPNTTEITPNDNDNKATQEKNNTNTESIDSNTLSSLITSSNLNSEDVNHSIILKLANQSHLNQLASAGYDRLDAAYALVYKSNYNRALELIKRGISSDPEFRFHVDSIVSMTSLSDDLVRHEIEMVKIEARKMNEDEKFAVSALIAEVNCLKQIKDKALKDEARETIQRYQFETHKKIEKDLSDDKQLFVFESDGLKLMNVEEIMKFSMKNSNKKTLSLQEKISISNFCLYF